MKCHEAQRELALHAGEDLGDSQREAEIQQHLAECPTCRRRHAGVKSALAALAVVDTPATYESVHSLWPGVRRRIAQGGHSASAGWSWQTAGPVIAGLLVCTGLMISTAVLLQRPVVSDAPVATEPTLPSYPGYEAYRADRVGHTPPADTPPGTEEKPGRSVLTRRLTLPRE